MPAHRRARRQNRPVADRLQDIAVLALESFAIAALGNAGPAANGLPRDDEAPEVFQKAPELRIAGGIGDAAMERKILDDGILAALDGGADSFEAVHDFAKLRDRGARRRQSRSLDLDPGAQFH